MVYFKLNHSFALTLVCLILTNVKLINAVTNFIFVNSPLAQTCEHISSSLFRVSFVLTQFSHDIVIVRSCNFKAIAVELEIAEAMQSSL